MDQTFGNDYKIKFYKLIRVNFMKKYKQDINK